MFSEELVLLWSETGEGVLHEYRKDGLLVMEAKYEEVLMERIEVSRIADTKTVQAMKTKRDKDAQSLQNLQTPAVQAEVPCCCAGCFSFDF